MVAKLIVIPHNGYYEAHDPSIRDRYETLSVPNDDDIKMVIWEHLQKTGRDGCVLVKYNNRMFLCEMKQNRKGYTKAEIKYHPYQDKFQ